MSKYPEELLRVAPIGRVWKADDFSRELRVDKRERFLLLIKFKRAQRRRFPATAEFH